MGISNEAIRCLLIDPRAALVLMRPGDVFEASVFNVSEAGMRRVIGRGFGDTPSEAGIITVNVALAPTSRH